MKKKKDSAVTWNTYMKEKCLRKKMYYRFLGLCQLILNEDGEIAWISVPQTFKGMR